HPGDVTPRVATVADVLANAQAWESTVVKLNDVTLSGASTFSGEVIVTDATGSMIMFTRSQSTFAGNALPTEIVSVTALISEFNAPQLIIRNANDVPGGGTGPTGIDESFTNIANDADISLPGWANIAVKGTRLWRGKIFQTNHYAQATAFGDTGAEMEAWLITPTITLDEAKKINFETAKSFHVHDGLSVWVSSNFDGTNVTGATWVPLSAVIATAAAADNEWIPSGDIDLSGFTGPIRVGFKYIGSGPGGQTTTFRVDNVKVTNL
ncbi:MAG: choice-of-anchor J domain-containing protein, partial [Bacteroidota bacterium]|nr:choice-of-anchor J domain-containing protein [Bacteroidota bacterium]